MNIQSIPKVLTFSCILLFRFSTLFGENSISNSSDNNSSHVNLNISEFSNLSATITFNQLPRNLQFFARDNQDSSLITYSGTLYTTGYDSVYMELFKNNVYQKRKSIKLTYSGGSSVFNISQKIHAELSEYKTKFYLKSGTTSTLLSSADSMISGDAYIISGQSNSNATDARATFKSEFCRSFGVQTNNYNSAVYNPADTNWGLSKADGAVIPFSGPYNVGVWGLQLQKLIKETYGIPTCIINGGRASSLIEMHLRNNSNPVDLNTSYGRLLYRVNKSGLANNIKAVFWLQGESNGDASWMNYLSNFYTLHTALKENFPNFSKFYLFQTRPCCSERFASQLREVQRRIPEYFPNIELMSTVGISYFYGCHYGYEGYLEVASKIFKPLSKNFYNSTDTVNMKPPNIRAAYYTTAAKNEIGILFDNSKVSYWPADTLGQRMKNYFYLDGLTGNVNTGVVSGDTLKLKLFTASNATKLTYLTSVWNTDDSLVYEGPFLRNPAGIGALSFHDFPVSKYSPSVLNLTVAVEGLYNTATNKLNVKDTLRIYVRNNYFPYSIRDSAKSTIDSLSLTGKFTFGNLLTGTYYIVIKGKNIIETWSKSPGILIIQGATTSYNFTTSNTQAYGSNQKLKGSKYCIYSADVNQDGAIDAVDNSLVSNGAFVLLQGYSSSDLNGDKIVDASDLNISDANTFHYVSAITP